MMENLKVGRKIDTEWWVVKDLTMKQKRKNCEEKHWRKKMSVKKNSEEKRWRLNIEGKKMSVKENREEERDRGEAELLMRV